VKSPAVRRKAGERPPRKRIADAREQFLTSQELEPDVVRDSIVASWWRSHRLHVEADHIDLPYVPEVDTHSPLVTCAAPILRQLSDQLQAEPVSIILTDAEGVVLERIDSDHAIASHLDRVELAPGYSYAEQFVGTNGIGTALAERVPTLVDGHEHYAEHLERLVCAGVPIRHPVQGTLLGALDLTSWSGESNSLMLALATSTAERIERSLLTRTGVRELELFREYLRTCQRTNGIVLALNGDVVMMNETARRTLTATDQQSLLEWAADMLDEPKPNTVIADLPSGLTARLRYRPVFGRSGAGPPLRSGGVLDVQFTQTPAHQPALGQRDQFRDGLVLPGVVGGSVVWQRCAREIDSCYAGQEWLVLTGESGTGKLALLRAVHQHRDPAGHFRVFDAIDTEQKPDQVDDWLDAVANDLAETQGTLVVTHADRLSTEALIGLGELLQEHATGGSGGSSWVAITMSEQDHSTDVEAHLLPHFPHTVQVPSLRHHSEDVRDLVTALLASIARGHHLTFASDAMQQLSRSPWPGNVAQLRKVLVEVVQRRRSGTVTAADLPPETRSAIRRHLSQLESLERDAIVRSLTTHRGNKAQACAELGMSRATIYRKIRDYGITGI
jgi:sigma-54 dependent transcriptional regulator, acetoin dehydrogenase operon transcriptional activator AcoR